MDRLQLLLMPAKHQPDLIYLRHVPLRRVHLFTFLQVCVCVCGHMLILIQDSSLLLKCCICIINACVLCIDALFGPPVDPEVNSSSHHLPRHGEYVICKEK